MSTENIYIPVGRTIYDPDGNQLLVAKAILDVIPSPEVIMCCMRCFASDELCASSVCIAEMREDGKDIIFVPVKD